MQYLYNKLMISFIACAVLLSGMVTITIAASKEPSDSVVVSSTADSSVKEKRVVSVYIEKGDSLWSIAQKYFTEDNVSMKAYIEEIKKCNHLSSNQIKEGQNLIVPYYVAN